MRKHLTLEEINEIYWSSHPNLRGLVEIIHRWYEKNKSGNMVPFVKLNEIETGRMHITHWCSVKNLKCEGVPDTFKCHPYSLESMNETYWNIHPELRGLVQIIDKWGHKSSIARRSNTFIKLKELSTEKTYNLQWSTAKNPKRSGIPDTFKCHPYSLESMNEIYWNIRPNLRGIVQIIEKWGVKSKTKTSTAYVKLKELSTNRTYDIRWSSVTKSNNKGVPDTFKCHPHSLESMNEIYWNIRPNLRGIVQIIEKWGHKSSASSKAIPYVKLKELSTNRTYDIRWNSVTNTRNEGVPPHFDCYDGTKNLPSNDKLCLVYLCKTTTYGDYDKYKNGPYLTMGITTRNVKYRYSCNGHIETYFELETYNCIIHEKALLKKITISLGKPNAGKEAWVFSSERKEKMTRIFNEHFNLLSP